MTKRSGIQLCYPFEEKRLAKWTLPVFVQPKLDGERCRALLSPTGVMLLSSEENEIVSVPHIKEYLMTVAKKLGKPIELDGELYIHGTRQNETRSIVGRTVNLNPFHETMQYHIFDIIDENITQIERVKTLLEIRSFFTNPSIQFVETMVAEDFGEIMRIYEGFIEEEYEGIVVRHMDAPYVRRRSLYAMKFKPKKTDIYSIVGYKEEVDIKGKPKGVLGSLICSDPEGNTFGVSGLFDSDKELLWKVRDSLTLFDVKVGYQHISGKNKVPLSANFKELVEREEEPTIINPLL